MQRRLGYAGAGSLLSLALDDAAMAARFESSHTPSRPPPCRPILSVIKGTKNSRGKRQVIAVLVIACRFLFGRGRWLTWSGRARRNCIGRRKAAASGGSPWGWCWLWLGKAFWSTTGTGDGRTVVHGARVGARMLGPHGSQVELTA